MEQGAGGKLLLRKRDEIRDPLQGQVPLLHGQKNIPGGKILFPERLEISLAVTQIIAPGFIELSKEFSFQVGTILMIGSFVPGNGIFQKIKSIPFPLA